LRIAIVHDWLISLGGAERVLLELHRIFPSAPIYTLLADPVFLKKHLPYAKVVTSNLDRFPFARSLRRTLALAMPMAVESFDLSEYDAVLSSSVFFAKGLILKPRTRHVCYCYSPTRQLWDRTHQSAPGFIGTAVKQVLRIWDRQAAERVDRFIAISAHVQERIRRYYGRQADVVYPPLSLEDANPGRTSDGGYFLIVSRLFPHKNIEVAVDAFNKLGSRLVIVGDGPLREKLERAVRRNITFVGSQSDDELLEWYRHARALIMPQEEDFGLTPLEIMQFGKPVLALRRGGALETVQERISGEFFDDPIPEALADGVKRLNEKLSSYDPETIKASVRRFSRNDFERQIRQLVL